MSNPLAPPPPSGNGLFDRWMYLLWDSIKSLVQSVAQLTNGGDTTLHSHPAFTGDSGSGGAKGMVPAPATGDATKYLRGNGTWATVSGGGAVPNVIDSDLEVEVDTSYIVAGYLRIEATLTVNGNVAVI